MSKESARSISLNDLLAMRELLRNYINDLLNLTLSKQTQLSNMRASLRFIQALASEKPPEEAMVPLDPTATALLRVPVKADSVVVYIGNQYYAEVSPDIAKGIVEEQVKRVEDDVKSIEKEIEKASRELNELEAFINSVVSAARQATARGKEEKPSRE